jgi:hypothetical protein
VYILLENILTPIFQVPFTEPISLESEQPKRFFERNKLVFRMRRVK